MVIHIVCSQDAFICVNSTPLGKICADNSLSLPLGDNPMLVCAYPLNNSACLWCYLFCEDKKPKILSQNARLSLWSEDIAELEFFTCNSSDFSPPIVCSEKRWGDSIAGICDGWFLLQTSKQTFFYKTRGVLSFSILNDLFALLRFCDYSIIIDRLCTEKLVLSCGEIKQNGNVLEETFSSFSFFKIRRKFDLRTLDKISHEVLHLTPQTPFEKISCFCEAVRLNLKDEALALMTPSLQQELSFDKIRDFLGPFDKIEKPRHKNLDCKNAFCLRYALDECNFHYICYEVEFDMSTGCNLIDNICEL